MSQQKNSAAGSRGSGIVINFVKRDMRGNADEDYNGSTVGSNNLRISACLRVI
jgi:hypothetical protein